TTPFKAVVHDAADKQTPERVSTPALLRRPAAPFLPKRQVASLVSRFGAAPHHAPASSRTSEARLIALPTVRGAVFSQRTSARCVPGGAWNVSRPVGVDGLGSTRCPSSRTVHPGK